MEDNPHDFSFDDLRRLSIGTVESVSPKEIKVLLETDAPENTAINTGTPIQFPKINGYVLIPNELGALIGMISWMGIEHSQYPKRKELKDFNLIDLPYPLRKLYLTPLGILKKETINQQEFYKIERGVYSYPSIGDSVVLPSQQQLRAIAENTEKGAVVKIGTSPLAGNANIQVNPDKLFGRHLAILGNTGSGKSCSVVGLVRWSLEEAAKNQINQKTGINARFIILDPNGEYMDSFKELQSNINVKRYKVTIKKDEKTNQLLVPAWLWNSNEWISFSRAQPGTQRPLLNETLIGLKRNYDIKTDTLSYLDQTLDGYLSYFRDILAQSTVNVRGRYMFEFQNACINFIKDIESFQSNDQIQKNLESLRSAFEEFYNSQLNKNKYFNICSNSELENIIEKIQAFKNSLSVKAEGNNKKVNADTPKYFELDKLPKYLEELSKIKGSQLYQFANLLNLRLNGLLNDERIKEVINPEESFSIQEWLDEFIQSPKDSGKISIIDLSLIPNNLIHLTISIISRIIFEALQRYQKFEKKGSILPTSIILEEAHTFIKKQYDDDQISAQNICRQTFERIAREGRKFGLGMVLSSQRPSELSPTILSQCNTFLLHRIVNDEDQKLVKRLIPDSIGNLLNELPILPTRKAILMGWATPIPVLVEMNKLPEKYQPQSADPDFWDVWTGNKNREVDWKIIADDWQGYNNKEREDKSEESDNEQNEQPN